MKRYLNIQKKKGLTVIEILLVLFLIGVIMTLVVPFSISFIDRQKERKKVLNVLIYIGDLKKKSVSYLQLGRISPEGDSLVFYLDNQVLNRINMPNPVEMEKQITFNRNGVSSGGEIQIKFSKTYIIKIEEISGIIKMETVE